MEELDHLKADFNKHVVFREKRPGIVQVLAPLYHEDGDMVDIFIDLPKSPSGLFRISDHGLSLMRLSYNCDFETPAKRKVLDRILSENGVHELDGRFFIEATREGLYPTLLQFAQTLAKVSSIQAFNREVVRSLFHEALSDFVATELMKYNPEEDYMPVIERADLEVDWCFDVQPKKIFLYGVNGSNKARLAALTCLQLQILNIPFRSVIVHDDFESGLSKKDQARITNVADKQFVSLADFKAEASQYFSREVSTVSIN